MKKTLICAGLLCAVVLLCCQHMAQAKEMNLHDAARVGEITRVRQILEQGTDVNIRDQQQNTPLHVAIYHGKIAVAVFLIHKGADINAYNCYHETPLFYAASQGQKEAAELLLQKGADVNARDASQDTPLFYAASKGKTEVVQLLLQKGAEVNAKDRHNETPLHWASSHGKTEVVTLLIKKGAYARGEKPVNIKGSEVKATTLHDVTTGQNVLKDSITGMVFSFIKGGCFKMGSDKGNKDERPGHTVCVGNFYMGEYEVTQGQWKSIMGNNQSWFTKCGDSCPVENVSWYDAQEFIRRLNIKTGFTKYRLPTEAEWEYAAKAGTESERYGDIGQIAWYDKNSGKQTHEVGQKKPNAWGLYDMLGNVWEWTQDWYGEYPSGLLKDPKGPLSGLTRVVRGGSWHSSAGDTRSAFRISRLPSGTYFAMGFRLVAMN
ncbi:MAG: SUMF1/EgtB/PvdO family nonheme iron enzyme [Syntrophales bacterium]|jgi:formylglycine-generating enzyme required for sulfatase activity